MKRIYIYMKSALKNVENNIMMNVLISDVKGGVNAEIYR